MGTTSARTLNVQGYAPRIREVLPGQHFANRFGDRVSLIEGRALRWTPQVLCEVEARTSQRQNQESTLGILRELSRLPEAINGLSYVLAALAKAQKEHAPAEDRLEELERSRSIWEAECEAELLKATSKYRAATAAETRTRKMNERLDPFDQDSDESQEGIPPEYAGASDAEGLLPLHPDLAVLDPKQLALRMKFS